MSLVGYKASNHPQQTARRGAKPEIDDRATDPEVFAALDRRFQFTLDVAATAGNTKLPHYYTSEDNGLEKSWRGERVWCNPPYSDIRPWVEKAWHEAKDAAIIVMLLPANRTEQRWWQELVEPRRDRWWTEGRQGIRVAVEFLPGRMRFIRTGSDAVGPNERPPFGCCLLIWRPYGYLTKTQTAALARGWIP